MQCGSVYMTVGDIDPTEFPIPGFWVLPFGIVWKHFPLIMKQLDLEPAIVFFVFVPNVSFHLHHHFCFCFVYILFVSFHQLLLSCHVVSIVVFSKRIPLPENPGGES